MSYTPGPWKTGPWSNGRQWIFGGPDGDKPICEVRGDVDARLIAAAPELLAALEEISAQMAELRIGADWEDRGFYGLKHARAAIARVRGKSTA